MNKASSRSVHFGFMLVEVLVSVLLFALGIVALVGLQAKMLGTTGEIRGRAEAVNLVNEYVASMWADGRAYGDVESDWETGGSANSSFVSNRVEPLLGSQTNPTMTVVFTNTPAGVARLMSAEVSVTVQWDDRKEASRRHSYSQTSPLVW
jgi:type IV pilus assembly protein PilV